MMSQSVTGKRQNFFKAVTSNQDRAVLLQSVITAQIALQLKEEGKKASGVQDLTIVKTQGRHEKGIIANYVTGPRLRPCELTVAFELSKAMFYCTGDLVDVREDKYIIGLRKI